MKNKIVSILLLVTFCVTAQKVEVKGQIRDKDSIEIPYANIVFKSIKNKDKIYGTLGDDNGFFTIKIPIDNYSVEISMVGIQSKTFNLELTNANKVKDLGIIIVSNNMELEEVTIKSNKNGYKIGLDKKVYNVSQDVIAKGGTLVDVMQSLPSVQIESDGNVSIRGDQNVRILIDGKPSGLTSTSSLFSTIPSSSIEKVEVITNPSSKYSAEGTAGIINVILKKGKKKRFNSSIEVFTGHRLRAGFNANITKNNEKGSWYVNAGVGYSEPKAVNNVFLQTPNDNPNSSSQESDRIREQLYFLTNIGGSRDFNTKNSISGSITFRNATSDNNNVTFNKDFDNGVLLATSDRKEKEEETNNFIQGDFGYKHKFLKEGHIVDLNVSAELTNNDESSSIIGRNIFPVEQNINQDELKNDEERNRYAISMDYTLPLKNKVKLELGYRSNFSTIKNDFSTERTQNNIQFTIPEFTGNSNYKETVHAFYSQFSKTINKFSIRLGLRTEISDIKITNSNDKKYTDLFPSSFFTYKFNEKSSLQLSLSRRVNRPASWMIVPLSTFTDERNVFVGNPNINPSYIIASELSYSTKFSNKISVYPTIYYRKTTDEMEFFVEKQQITIGNDTQDVFVSKIANIGDYYAFGSEIGVSYKPNNWWNMYGEIVLNGFKQRGFFNGASFDGDGILISGRYNSTFNFFKSMKFQIQNYYRGPIETGQYRRKGYYGMNIGISNDVFKGNGTIALNVRDVFNSNIRKVRTQGDDFTRDLELQFRVRQINLSLTYRLNQKKHKGKKGNQYDDYDMVN